MTVVVREGIVQGHASDHIEKVRGSMTVAVGRFDNSALLQEHCTPPKGGSREWWGVHDWCRIWGLGQSTNTALTACTYLVCFWFDRGL